jgi:hypothetical protein
VAGAPAPAAAGAPAVAAITGMSGFAEKTRIAAAEGRAAEAAAAMADGDGV